MSKKFEAIEFVERGALERALQEATGTLNFSVAMREHAEQQLATKREVVEKLEQMYDEKARQLDELAEGAAQLLDLTTTLALAALEDSDRELEELKVKLMERDAEISALKWQLSSTKQATYCDESVVSCTAHFNPEVIVYLALVEMESYELAVDVCYSQFVWLPDSPNKIERIKSLRKQFRGMGLEQAKDFVEAYDKKYPYAE